MLESREITKRYGRKTAVDSAITYYWMEVGVTLALCAGLYAVTGRIMERRLNV